MKRESLHEQIQQLTKEKEAFSEALSTSNQAFMEKVKEFSIIKRLADSLQVGMNRRQICSEIVDIIIDETTAENCSLWLLDKCGEVLSLYAARSQDELQTRYFEEGHGRNLEVGKGAAGWVALKGESLLIEDVNNSSYFLADEALQATHPQAIQSLLCLPIKGNAGLLGVLNLSHPDIGAFSQSHERLLQLITDQAGIGLTNNQLFEEVQELNKSLERKVTKRTIHLKRSEERYQRAIKAGRVGIWEWQVGSPEIYLAPNLISMLGYEPTEQKQYLKDWLRIVYKDDRKQFLRNMMRQLKGTETLYEGEHRMRHKNGDLLWFFVRVAAVVGAGGRLSMLVGSNTDITKRKKAELKLVKAQEEALVNAHAAGKAEFATTVLHNIGNVLNSVNVDSLHVKKTLEKMRLPQLTMACELLAENKDDLKTYLSENEKGKKIPEYLGKLAEVIARDSSTISRLADDIAGKVDLMRDIIETQQSYATAGRGAMPHDLTQLVEEALKVQMDSIRKRGVTLKQRFSKVPPIMVNGSKLIHVIINLTKNAVEAMESVSANERVLTVRLGKSGSKVMLTIKDTGMGISSENLPKMFQHGFTTKKTGHGFGLHYCARTIETMGGEISVESDGEGKGATFKIMFMAIPPAEKRRKKPLTNRKPKTRGITSEADLKPLKDDSVVLRKKTE